MPPAKAVGLPSYRSCRELSESLESGGVFTVRRDVPARIAIALRERELAAALLGPVDFARDSSDYQILPGVALAFAEGWGALRLHFRTGTRRIATLAADPSSSSEIVLARIILAEEFESTPAILPAQGTLEALLEKADAVLSSDELSGLSVPHPGESLDLVEAWRELTDLPLVAGVWACRENALEDSEVAAIQLAHRAAEERTVASAIAGASTPGYALTSAVEEGLRSFWHYAYYHGLLPDIPELRYYSPVTSEEPPPASS